MPTYDYVCTECTYRFDKLQQMSDDKLEICPECNGALKRLIGSGSAVIYKTGGFYSTDNKKRN